jgi:hypothetical protein
MFIYCSYCSFNPLTLDGERVKEFLVSKNPDFNYSVFCLEGFKKTFPILSKSDPLIVTNWLYQTVSAFSGRDGRCLAGGGFADICAAIAAAADIELEVYAAREIKDALRARLRWMWLDNDHATIMSVARGFERNASMAVIDHLTVEWIDPHRIFEELDNEDEIEIHKAVEEWVETLCEPSQARSVIGNRSRKKLRRKPAERAIKSLFECV